jgi:protein phosphatase
VSGKRLIETRLHRTVTIRDENATAALEVMSRFAANPKWLIYLPPTMSPSETSQKDPYLEYPTEALEFYRRAGVDAVVCEEKHMGSRAVVIVCRDDAAAERRFGVQDEGRGIIYTRTGRRFFADAGLEHAVLERLAVALDRANFWARFQTDWFCLDCELMPWSVKAEELLRVQYAPTGAAAQAAIAGVREALGQASARGLDVGQLGRDFAERALLVNQYIDAYRHYCWPVHGVQDIKLAPFHILASEGTAHVDKTHLWHMETLAELCAADPDLLLATPYRTARLDDAEATREIITWWEQMTARGGEGMVIKPVDFVALGKRGLLQPGIKCRGPEYLRIIYGPEYSRPEHLVRLRERGLSTKRSMAIREFALGIESLERFVRREPLRRVHECVFGVLALESEPVDPRL